MSRLVVYGAGGHGRVVADAAVAAGFDVIGFLDDAAIDDVVVTLPVFGDLAWLVDHSDVLVAHGIGNNHVRERLARDARRIGRSFTTVLHPSAVVSPSAGIGEGAVVLATAVLNSACTIGDGAIINTGAIVEHDCVVGAFAHVASGAGLAGGAQLQHKALLGSGARVLPGRVVCPGSVVGAGAVVTRDVPPGVVVVGVPARIRRNVR